MKTKIIKAYFFLRQKKLKSGQSIIELLLVVGLAAIFIPALTTGLFASRAGKVQERQRVEAISILKETQEATRSVRERDWASFAINGTFYPVLTGNTWSLATGSGSIGDFTRTIQISNIYRDATGTIVTTGGNLDLSTKKIIATVSWGNPYSASISATTYLTRYLENDTYTETTQAQFNSGTLNGIVVQATTGTQIPDDGEIILGAGGNSNWCEPTLLASSGAYLDLPGQGYPSTVTAIEGKAFMGTGENASGLSFMSANVSNTQPPVATLGNTFDGHKTNNVYGETNYGYIATDTNSKEIVIIDITGASYVESGYFNAPGNGSGKGIYVLGSTGYMTVANKLYNFDLSSKSGSRPIIDSNGVTLAGLGTDIQVIGNYAYVSISGAATELQIVDVSTPTNLQVIGQADVNGQAAKSLFVDSTGNRTYLATGNSSSQSELFIINTSTKTGNRPIVGSYNSSGMDPRAVTVVPGNRAIIVGHGGEEYQVVNIANESSPTSCGGSQMDSGINDISSIIESDGDAYSYIMTGETDKEFRIIEGGPGGSYASAGTFESVTFNPGYSTANNRLSATFSEPQDTDIKFQVALGALINGTCPTTGNYTFIGPDGTSGTYFNQASAQPITFPFTTFGNYTNPGQCFRYKAFLDSTNTNSTPVLNDVTINYSP